MDKIELILTVIALLADVLLLILFFDRLRNTEKNTERAAEALEFIASRLEQDSADNVLSKIEEELNAKSKETTNSR